MKKFIDWVWSKLDWELDSPWGSVRIALGFILLALCETGELGVIPALVALAIVAIVAFVVGYKVLWADDSIIRTGEDQEFKDDEDDQE